MSSEDTFVKFFGSPHDQKQQRDVKTLAEFKAEQRQRLEDVKKSLAKKYADMVLPETNIVGPPPPVIRPMSWNDNVRLPGAQVRKSRRRRKGSKRK